MTEDFEFEPKLSLSDSIISASKSSVLAKVEIIKSFDEVTFNSIPVRVLSTPEIAKKFDIKLYSEVINVLLSGTKSNIEMVKSDQIKAFLDVSNLVEAGTYNVEVDCSISGSTVTVENRTPAIIKVTLTEKK